MQIVITIPRGEELQRYGGAEEALLQDVSGVPLLVRVLATGLRAGGDRALVVHREAVPHKVQKALRSSKILTGLLSLEFMEVREFDPASPGSWREIFGSIEDEFLWLPWNWVTNKHGLTDRKLVVERPTSWDRPARLSRAAVLSVEPPKQLPGVLAEGATVASPSSVGAAERWLVAHSGKPLDGMYSRFNRWLCRPLVRVLAHTAVTPNMVTFAGLLVGIVSAYSFAQGNYLASLTGALLFFLSGLLDEVDGMLARVRFSESVFGTWFEGSIDNLSYLLLFGGVTVGLYRQRGPQEVLLGELALMGAVLSIAIISWQRGRLTHAKRPNEYCAKMYRLLEEDRGNWLSRIARRIEFLLKKGVFIHYVLLFTALGLLPVLLRLAAFASNLTWILALYFSFRLLRRREPGLAPISLSKAT
jgi:phosphatidylglycerophosphate synthase